MDNDVELTFTEGKSNGSVIRLFCAHCRSKNKHTVIASSYERANVNDGDMWFNTAYYIARCNGCDEQRFSTLSTSSEDISYVEDRLTGKYEAMLDETIKQYPFVNIEFEEPHSYFSTPFELRTIYNETYIALCADAKKLASIGMRSVIETLCALNAITDDLAFRLPDKIEMLLTKRIISPVMKDVLSGIKEFGDRGAHTLDMPKDEELKVAWDAINRLVSAIYGAEDTQMKMSSLKGFKKRVKGVDKT